MDKIKTQLKAFDISDFFTKVFPVIGLIVVTIFFNIVTGGRLLVPRNITRLLIQSLPTLVGCLAAAFLLAQNLLDLSIGSVLGLSAVCGAYASHISPFLALPVALFVGLGVGAVNAILHGVLKVNPLIATMAMSFIIRGMLQPFCNYGSVSLNTKVLYAFKPDWIKLTIAGILLAASYIVFEYTKVGKQCKAVGGSETAATQSGINVKKIKIIGFLLTGFAAGIAGFLSLVRTGTSLPSTGNLFEFDVLIALVIGGMPITGGSESRIRSAVIGTFILVILSSGMTMWGIAEYPQQITKGIVFLIVLIISFTFKKKSK